MAKFEKLPMVKIFTGPVTATRIAEAYRELGFESAFAGTEHVYIPEEAVEQYTRVVPQLGRIPNLPRKGQ